MYVSLCVCACVYALRIVFPRKISRCITFLITVRESAAAKCLTVPPLLTCSRREKEACTALGYRQRGHQFPRPSEPVDDGKVSQEEM